MLTSILYNVLQLLVVLLCAPLIKGVLDRLKERVQAKRGPSIFQVYRDIWKLFHKDQVIPQESSWIFSLTPYITFIIPLFIALLIPVLTNYPLFFAFLGDMLTVGFLLSLSGFFATIAAIDTANPYGPVGASRTRMVSILAEPVGIIVFFTISYVANSTIPYIVQERWINPPATFFAPAHVLLLIAFIMLIIAEHGRIPVDNPSGHFELAMIDESKVLEYSGKAAALMKWGSSMKFFVVLVVFLNVLVAPWGLAANVELYRVLLAIPLVLIKMFLFLLLLVAIESSLSKLRLFRISEFLGAAFIISVTSMIAQIFSS